MGYNHEFINKLYNEADIKLLNEKKVNSRNKIAFSAPLIYTVDHFEKIWRHLDKKDFDVLVEKPYREYMPDGYYEYYKFNHNFLCQYLQDRGINYYDTVDCIKELIQYDFLLTFGLAELIFPTVYTFVEYEYKIAKKHIRYMTHGFNRHNYNPNWNKYYWMFLCQGEYQYNSLERYQNTAIRVITGYPRLDDFFTNETVPFGIFESLRYNGKKTILWMPTHGEGNSLIYFYEIFLKLSDDFNLILKPHDNCFTDSETSNIIKYLETSKKVFIYRSIGDDTILYRLADYIIADYGGTLFSCIYADKNTLLLHKHKRKSNYDLFPMETFLRTYIITVSDVNADLIKRILMDDQIWSKQKLIRQALRNKFFAPYYGFSGEVTANLLKNIRSVDREHLILTDDIKIKEFGYPLVYRIQRSAYIYLRIVMEKVIGEESTTKITAFVKRLFGKSEL